jgi:hypothetical protein
MVEVVAMLPGKGWEVIKCSISHDAVNACHQDCGVWVSEIALKYILSRVEKRMKLPHESAGIERRSSSVKFIII